MMDLVLTTKARVPAIPARVSGDLVGEDSRVMIQAKIEKATAEALAPTLKRMPNPRRSAESAPPIQAAPLTREDTMFVQIIHTPLRRKGKWTRYPDDV